MFSFSPDCTVRHCHVSAEKAFLRVLIAIASKIHAVPSFVCCYRDVVPHVAYTYQVQTVSGRSESEPSPPLIHELGAPYCGDGRIQRWDETAMLACAVIFRNKGLNLPNDPHQQLQRWGVRWYEHCQRGWLLQSVQEGALLQLRRWVLGLVNLPYEHHLTVNESFAGFKFSWRRWSSVFTSARWCVRTHSHERMKSTSDT